MKEFCTVRASTKRNTRLGDGERGELFTHLTRLMITPLYPLSGETARTLALNSPREAKECYHLPEQGSELPDVKEGDRLVIAGVEYPIRAVSEWNDPDLPSLHIVVGEIKRG